MAGFQEVFNNVFNISSGACSGPGKTNERIETMNAYEVILEHIRHMRADVDEKRVNAIHLALNMIEKTAIMAMEKEEKESRL
jgi:hypothetical protein